MTAIEKYRQQTKAVRPLPRFPYVKDEARRHLSVAIDFEREAGNLVRAGQLEKAEEFRVVARESWGAARAFGL